MNYLFLNKNFALKLQGNCWKECGNVYSTSERNYQTFNKIQAKSSFGRHVGGQEYALQHGGQYKSYYFVKKIKLPLKISLKCVSSQISSVR